MNRIDAHNLVIPFIENFNQYKVINHDNAKFLLNDTFYLLLNDPIRKNGPSNNTIYYYNVVDYLVNPNPKNLNQNQIQLILDKYLNSDHL